MENQTETPQNTSQNCSQTHCMDIDRNEIERIKYVYSVTQKLNITGISIGITAIVLNLAFLYAMTKVKRKDKAHYRFIKSLSISDFCGSLSFIVTVNFPPAYLGVIAASDFAFLRALPYVIRSVPWMFFTAYLLTLTCLTVNQYLAVCKPWEYTAVARNRRVTISLIFLWLVSSLHVLIPFGIIVVLSVISNGQQDPMPILHKLAAIEILVWMIIFAFTISFNIITTLVIYRKLVRLQLRSRTVCNSRLIKVPPNVKKKQEIFVTLSFLLLASIFCRLPFPIIGIIGFTSASKIDYITWEIINGTLSLLLYVNFLVDPVIYFLRMKELRNVLMRPWRWVLVRLRKKRNANLRQSNRFRHQAIEQHELQEIGEGEVVDLRSSSTPLNVGDVCFQFLWQGSSLVRHFF